MFSARKPLSNLEQTVLESIWGLGTASTDSVREALALTYPMKESTARTILRRLEEKGYVVHEAVGRVNIYRPVEKPEVLAAKAAGNLVNKFCGGSVEKLLLGMVDHDVIDEQDLKRLAETIAKRRKAKK